MTLTDYAPSYPRKSRPDVMFGNSDMMTVGHAPHSTPNDRKVMHSRSSSVGAGV